MDRIDRLGWTAGFSFASYGARIGFRTNQASLLERLSSALPPGSTSRATPVVDDLYSLIAAENDPNSRIRRYNLLYAGASRVARTMNLDEVFTVLQEHLHLTVAVRSPRRLFVRAGVVAWGTHAVVVVADDAPLVASVVSALMTAGATYYSNQYAVFDRRGRVHAYPTPLADGSPCSDRRQRPLRTGLIVVVGPARQNSSARELSPAQAALTLLSHTVVSRLRPAFALRILRESVAGAVTLDLCGEDDAAIVAQVVDQLRR